jgi:hypothetical protein
MVCGTNPLKVVGTNNYIPRVEQTLNGWRKTDDPVEKKLPVEVDVPELLVRLAMMVGVLEMAKATADLILIAFYYLLRVGEYTHKAASNNTKQTVEFRAEDVTFFKRFEGRLKQLPREAPDEDIMSADSSTLKIDNQKNGWHGVCINHEHNGDEIFSPVRDWDDDICTCDIMADQIISRSRCRRCFRMERGEMLQTRRFGRR